jgi:hypothetical protein
VVNSWLTASARVTQWSVRAALPEDVPEVDYLDQMGGLSTLHDPAVLREASRLFRPSEVSVTVFRREPDRLPSGDDDPLWRIERVVLSGRPSDARFSGWRWANFYTGSWQDPPPWWARPVVRRLVAMAPRDGV